ncbi:hypothetical protein A6A40_22440 (plasmid) [Azospirillum humicireducens]|uniref:Phenol degradation protein meta n=2 Tax=Azospirillum humicireducens TaxID=1226968 RepID=A0A2R4VTR7_9PROT|nr:hypothetical protein A6A40_22440 [Azospirillum humicireducens]
MTVMAHSRESRISGGVSSLALAVAVAGWLGLAASPAEATEGGTSQYIGGSAQFYGAGIPPFPGTYILSQTNFYAANRLNDGNGNKIPIDFSLKTYSNTFRLLHVSDIKLAGADVWGQLVLPVVHGDLSIMGRGDTQTSIADVTGTAGLVWHMDGHSLVVGLDIAAPTGRYKKENMFNIGANHWAIQPVLGYKYFDPQGLDLSLVPRVVFNTKNTATDYTSGNELYIDYAVGWNFGPTKVGLVGYAYQQLTDDKGRGVGSDGNKGKAFAIGPSLTYSFSPGLHVSGSWQRDLVAEHRTQGNNLWFNVGFKL